MQNLIRIWYASVYLSGIKVFVDPYCNDGICLLQFQKDVVENKFPAERDAYIKLTGLMAQV